MGTGRKLCGIVALAAFSLLACGEITVPPDPSDGDTGDAVGDVSGDVSTNRAPIVQPIALSARTGVEGLEMTFDVKVSDPDSDGIKLSIEGKPAKATFDDASGRFRWRPDPDTATLAEGSKAFPVVFVATDDGSPPQTARLEVQIFVQNDEDRDGRADEQDDDLDGDGLTNAAEVALGTKPEAADTDEDGVCDGGGELGATTSCQDGPDNCPLESNADQLDTDKDGQGDGCDPCPKDALNDADGDGHCADEDNCPTIANADQLNTDGDAFGDACDDWILDPLNDQDEDGVPEPDDNCPTKANQLQEDSDLDGAGDVCDPCPLDADDDIDSDGKCGNVDNCPTISNADQKDTDADKIGDACDSCKTMVGIDVDGDGVCELDNCPDVSNKDQLDTDKDGQGDACDTCPLDKDNDKDGDGKCADVDNCPALSNPGQENADGDAMGDVCDICPKDALNDKDGDGFCGDVDTCPDLKSSDQTDTDLDGKGDPCDTDDDDDGRLDAQDNCPKVKNFDQANLDGDDEGDACDPDDDGDGAPDLTDNCPRLNNPDQIDFDGDLLGMACDAFESLPEALYPLGAATQVVGSARGGTLALAFVEELDCTLASGACEPPGIFTLQNIEDVKYVAPWLTPTSTSLIAPPFVGQGGEAFFSIDFGTTGRFDRVVDGLFTANVGGITSAELDQPVVLTDLLSGSTLLQTRLKLYELFGKQVIQKSSGKNFRDSYDHGVVVASDGVVYQPVTSSTSLVSLLAFGQDGKIAGGLSDSHQEIRYLGPQPNDASGNPWYCVRRLATDPPRLVQMAGGAIGASHVILGGTTCAPDKLLDVALTPDGQWWFEYLGTSSRNVGWWNTANNASAVVFAGEPRDATFHLAGNAAFVSFDDGDGTTETFAWNAAGQTADPLGWACDDTFKTTFQTASRGFLGAVGRSAQTGVSGELVACVATAAGVSSATFDAVPAGTTTTPKALWFDDTPDGNFYAHVLHATKHYVVAMARDGNDYQPQLLFETFGKARLTANAAVTVLGIDGDTKGIYQLAASAGAVTPTKLFDAAESHSPVLLTQGSADSSGGVWIDWKKLDGSFGLGRVTAVGGTVVESAMTGPVYDQAIHPVSGESWFAFDTSAGTTYGRVVGGTFTPWREALAELIPLYVDEDPAALWGAAWRSSVGGAYTICALPPAEACWELPLVNGDFLTAPLVSVEGNVYALLYDVTADLVRLWRNIDEPAN
ncbi:MAG: thrombospondin type 3 repeat-containing protein [Deltaproteobacteria bacterium]|nr:thrombospondin type 3 repeat-containing protein [Deltaproteobacteria bacterium]